MTDIRFFYSNTTSGWLDLNLNHKRDIPDEVIKDSNSNEEFEHTEIVEFIVNNIRFMPNIKYLQSYVDTEVLSHPLNGLLYQKVEQEVCRRGEAFVLIDSLKHTISSQDKFAKEAELADIGGLPAAKYFLIEANKALYNRKEECEKYLSQVGGITARDYFLGEADLSVNLRKEFIEDRLTEVGGERVEEYLLHEVSLSMNERKDRLEKRLAAIGGKNVLEYFKEQFNKINSSIRHDKLDEHIRQIDNQS